MRKAHSSLIPLIIALLICGCISRPSGTHGNARTTAAPSDSETGAAASVSLQSQGTNDNPPTLLGKLLAKPIRSAQPFPGEGWTNLCQDFQGWKEVRFAGGGEIESASGIVLLNMGEPFTGIRYTNMFPVMNYEIAFDAMRVMGSDFFCGLTFPVDQSHGTLVVGGWGGSLVGISSVDGMDASENQTTRFMNFEKEQWYRIRLRVTRNRIEAWIDVEKVVDLVTKHRQITLRPGEIEMCKPLGLANWQTTAAFREIQWRPVDQPADPPRKE